MGALAWHWPGPGRALYGKWLLPEIPVAAIPDGGPMGDSA